jgi:cytosine/adenosine deaminase-related metal-dependent hydrolase
LARSEPIRFSAEQLDQGMQRIQDLYDQWHGAENGRIQVFPAAALTETSSPELLRAVRTFAEEHDLGRPTPAAPPATTCSRRAPA